MAPLLTNSFQLSCTTSPLFLYTPHISSLPCLSLFFFSRGDKIISWFSEMDQHLFFDITSATKNDLTQKSWVFLEEAISYSLCHRINCLASWRAMECPRVTWRWLPCGSLADLVGSQCDGCTHSGGNLFWPLSYSPTFSFCCMFKTGCKYKPLQKLSVDMTQEWHQRCAPGNGLHLGLWASPLLRAEANVWGNFSKVQWPVISGVWGIVVYEEEQLQMITALSKEHSYGNEYWYKTSICVSCTSVLQGQIAGQHSKCFITPALGLGSSEVQRGQVQGSAPEEE